MRKKRYFIVILSVAVTFAPQLRAADRTSSPLDGAWEIDDSKQPKPSQPRGTIRRGFRASRTPRSQLFPS
jgi:hypothetical protein